MSNLKTLIESFVKRNYRKVQRNDKAYRQTLDITTRELERLLDLYNGCIEEDQTARLIRDSIDHWIRRYHDYTIRGNIGSHYVAVGIKQGETVFEHIIPANIVRDMLIEGKLSINQALNAPTCLISKLDDVILRKNGLVSSSPDNWHFFDRYNVLNAEFRTYNGQAIADLHNWTLDEHYKFFNIA
jgi:hypothetical protein